MCDTTGTADTHPLVSQLSALHRFRIRLDVAVVVVVLVLTNLIAHFTTPWASIATVPAAAVGLVILMRCNGLGWADLGLGREHWKSGLGYALAAVRCRGVGDRRRCAATDDPADVHEQSLRDRLRRADRLDGHHPPANRDPRGAGLPRGAARCAEPGLGIPRCRAGGLAAVRSVACRDVAWG